MASGRMIRMMIIIIVTIALCLVLCILFLQILKQEARPICIIVILQMKT